MRGPVFSSVSEIKMTMSHQDASSESRIDKMRKFLSSPLTRKKPNGTHLKTFGTPLEILVQRSSPSEVPTPFIVTRICQYIEHGGLMHEGVFRISGNARLIERLKSCFDQTGDAPLETEGDVPSAAALLKLFFRELPEPIIPLSVHQQFLNAVKGGDKDESIAELAHLVEKLPLANYSVLKYLSYFLTAVCNYEEHNRMSASSLGIVFGPNLFRVTEDFVGLKEQSLTNQIVTYFITDYDAIFHDEPKYHKKSLSTSLEVSAKHSKLSMSTTDSMVASWPKLSAFPSLASTLNLRPLSVSIPTMGGSGFPLGSYAEPLDTKEHILMVDDLVPEEQCSSSEQISDQGEKDESKEQQPSSARRKRKERKIIADETLAPYSTCEEILPVQSRRQWKDFYYIDDTEDSFDQKTIVTNPQESNQNDITDENTVDTNTVCQRETTTAVVHASEIDEEEYDGSSSHSLHDELRLSSDQTTPLPSAEVSCKFEEVVDEEETLDKSEGVNSNHSLQKDFESMVGETVESPKEDRQEFPSDLRDDRPAREKRFGRSHKHYPRSAHRSYYSKKQFSSNEAKRPALSSPKESLPEPKGLSPDDSNSFQLTVECDSPSAHPPTDLAVTCDTYYENNGSSSDNRYCWPILKCFQDEEINQISPARQFLRLSGSSEAPLSPSAYRSYLSHRSPHLDPNLPPSPPVEQEDLATGPMDDINKTAAKMLSKKIQSLKKKIKRFEENFEATHSYRPSHAEKCQYPEVKKLIGELTQARQDLKQTVIHVYGLLTELKEEQTILDFAMHQEWTPSQDSILAQSQKLNKSTNTFRHNIGQSLILSEGASVTIEESLQESLDYLSEKRKSGKRPELLEDMSKEQLTEEKLCIQKILLQFESIHGRPSSRTHRDLMRPIYDRYRSAKRIIGKSASFGSVSKIKDAMELQPILEHETMDFRSLSAKELRVEPEECEKVVDNGNMVAKNENELDGEISCDSEDAKPFRHVEYDNEPKVVEIIKANAHANLHELSLPELFEHQQKARADKRNLRRILREFELEFQKEHGRKVQRDDKAEMESVYSEYKLVRARLKLLEALTTKHGQRK